MSSLPDAEQKPLMTVAETLDALDGVVKRSAIYAAIERGEVPGVVRIGRRVFLSTARLREWVGLANANGNNGAVHEESAPARE